MLRRREEIFQLNAILEAELEGRQIDHEHARHLAQKLATMFPGCAMTLGRVAERMSER